MSETAANRSIPEPRRPGLPATGRPASAHIRGAMIASFTAMFTATLAMVAPAALNGDIPHLAESIRFFAELADKHGGFGGSLLLGR